MKNLSLLIIFTLFLTFVFSCKGEEIENNKSSLVVNNLPEGKFFVDVYPSNTSKEAMRYGKGYIALTNGYNSPFTLIWYESISSGTKFIIIKLYPTDPNDYKTIVKIITAEFSDKGDAIIDWEDMIDL